jgi:hypothetical protein
MYKYTSKPKYSNSDIVLTIQRVELALFRQRMLLEFQLDKRYMTTFVLSSNIVTGHYYRTQ